MPKFNDKPVNRPASGYNGGGRHDDPHGVTAPATHGEEGLTRTQPHPMQRGSSGNVGDTVGRYVGSTGTIGQPRTHFFSAEATEGGETDSFQISDTEDFKFYPKHDSRNPNARYAFSRANAHSGSIRPYDSQVHWGLPGAPMSDTKAEYHDRNYREED